MENASKALIMAAEILFGTMFIAACVFAYYSWTNFSKGIDQNIEQTNINEFNSQFVVYDGRTDLTAHDVVTILNLIREYNLDKDVGYTINVTGNAVTNINTVINDIPKFLRR